MFYVRISLFCLFTVFVSDSFATAQPVMSAEEFSKGVSAGRTYYFSLNGRPFGAEQFFNGQRTLWRYENGVCVAGRWEADGEHICFMYDNDTMRRCWLLTGQPNAFGATLVLDDVVTDFVLEFTHSDNKPLNCPGPATGS